MRDLEKEVASRRRKKNMTAVITSVVVAVLALLKGWYIACPFMVAGAWLLVEVVGRFIICCYKDYYIEILPDDMTIPIEWVLPGMYKYFEETALQDNFEGRPYRVLGLKNQNISFIIIEDIQRAAIFTEDGIPICVVNQDYNKIFLKYSENVKEAYISNVDVNEKDTTFSTLDISVNFSKSPVRPKEMISQREFDRLVTEDPFTDADERALYKLDNNGRYFKRKRKREEAIRRREEFLEDLEDIIERNRPAYYPR